MGMSVELFSTLIGRYYALLHGAQHCVQFLFGVGDSSLAALNLQTVVHQNDD